MRDYMLLEYLRNKGRHDEDFRRLDEFEDYVRKNHMRGSKKHKKQYWDDDMYGHMWDEHPKHGRDRSIEMQEGTFDEFEAKEIVSGMYHYDGDNKHIGEHFSMHKAKEVFEKYKDHFVVRATPCDVYVAINAFYHDLNKVLKLWFGHNVDEKVILLAVTFWFKDDDYEGNKLMNYFE